MPAPLDSGLLAEDCGNDVDDNGDFRIDCDDPYCAEDAGCLALPAGDVCREALPVNGGPPSPWRGVWHRISRPNTFRRRRAQLRSTGAGGAEAAFQRASLLAPSAGWPRG